LDERDKICELVKSILSKDSSIKAEDIGIITPYSKQRFILQDSLYEYKLPLANRSRIQIDTVDAFQGKEKDLIIISAVRSNNFNKIGFLSDKRRLNVMLTRAKRGLIIVGNVDTLESDVSFRHLISYCRDNGLILKN
jgi:superfamily I DNA and/or RNA helicase